MNKITLLLSLLASTAFAGPYNGITLSTTTGRATQNLSGTFNIASSSQTPTTPTIQLIGASGNAIFNGTVGIGSVASTTTATDLSVYLRAEGGEFVQDSFLKYNPANDYLLVGNPGLLITNSAIRANASSNLHLGNANVNNSMIFLQGSDGKIGIGTTTPATKLHMSGGSITFDGDGARTMNLISNNGNTVFNIDSNASQSAGVMWRSLGANQWFMVTDFSGTSASNLHLFNYGGGKMMLGGTTRAPETQLEVEGSFSAGNPLTKSTMTASGNLQVGGTGDSWVSGNLGIGTTAPTYKLHVIGAIATNSTLNASSDITSSGNVSGNGGIFTGTVSGNIVRPAFGTVGSPGFQFNGDGDTGIYLPTGDTLGFTAGGSEMIRMSNSQTEAKTLFVVGASSSGSGAGWPGALSIVAPDTTLRPAIAMRSSNNSNYGFDFDSEQISVGRLDILGVIAGTRSPLLSIKRDGSGVGIGNTAPSTALHVTGGARITGLVSCDTIDTDANGVLSCGIDDGAGSLTATADETITGQWAFASTPTIKGAYVMVASHTLSASASFSFPLSGLAGDKYKIEWSFIKNTAGNPIWRFNADSGNNYRWAWNGYIPGSATVDDSASSTAQMYFHAQGGHTVGDTGYYTGQASFAIRPDDNTAVHVFGDNQDFSGTSHYFGRMGASYDGASAITTLDVSNSAGTLTGDVILYKLAR